MNQTRTTARNRRVNPTNSKPQTFQAISSQHEQHLRLESKQNISTHPTAVLHAEKLHEN